MNLLVRTTKGQLFASLLGTLILTAVLGPLVPEPGLAFVPKFVIGAAASVIVGAIIACACADGMVAMIFTTTQIIVAFVIAGNLKPGFFGKSLLGLPIELLQAFATALPALWLGALVGNYFGTRAIATPNHAPQPPAV